jgi:hypothetical protein
MRDARASLRGYLSAVVDVAAAGRVRVMRANWLFVALVFACGGSSESSSAPAPPNAPPVSPPSVATSDACPAAAGRVLSVGPGQPYTTVRAAALAAQDGDTVHIAGGDYHGDVATWRASNLAICGIGARARLFADGVHEGGKGIWVITGRDTTVVNVEFHDAKVPDRNGAGIRQEGRNLTLRSTGFFDNENGILTGNDSGSTITIEGSEFARNGFGDGYTHNIYVGKVGRLVVRASYFHEAKIGHQLKTRSRESVIENSYFVDGPSGTSSYLLNFDNGGRVLMRGNLLHKGPRADNSTLISHYTSIWGAAFNTLTLEHNTLVSTYSGGRFIDVRTGAAVALTANVFAGTNGPTLVAGAAAVPKDNVVLTASDFANAGNVADPDFWPTAAALSRITLAAPAVTDYVADAPRPLTLRALSGSARLAGALQSAR